MGRIELSPQKGGELELETDGMDMRRGAVVSAESHVAEFQSADTAWGDPLDRETAAERFGEAGFDLLP